MKIAGNPGTGQTAVREDARLARSDHPPHNEAFGVDLMPGKPLLVRYVPAVGEEPARQDDD
jgi:hypothetical protein